MSPTHAACAFGFRRSFQRISLLALLMAMVISLGAAQAQLPTARLTRVFPPGGERGTTVEVSARGIDLDEAGQLHFSHPGLSAVQKVRDPKPYEKGPQAVAGDFSVTIASEVPPGMYEVRAIGRFGISNPRAFMVGENTEIVETEPNDTFEQATAISPGTIVNGRGDDDSLDYFEIHLEKGQRVLIDCWAQRIDSRMDPTLVLFDPDGREVLKGRNTNRRDPLLDVTAAKAGKHIVMVHDAIYGGGNDYFYRLIITTGPYIDFIFPPAGLPGSTDQFVLYGRNLPGSSPAENFTVDGMPLEKLAVKISLPKGDDSKKLEFGSLVASEESFTDGMEYRYKSKQGVSNPVLVGFASAPVCTEIEPNDNPADAQKISLPCEYVGQFFPKRDRDWVTFEANKGEVYFVEVLSQRLGLPTDPFFIIQQVTIDDKGNEKVRDLATVDDLTPKENILCYNYGSDDPVHRFSVPEDGIYRILVQDRYHDALADPRYVYRLVIRPEAPDFRLVTYPRFPEKSSQRRSSNLWSTVLRKGGTALLDVLAFRQDGFDGPVEVSVKGLPDTIQCPPVTIGPGKRTATLVFTAAEDAAEWAGTIQIYGKAKLGDEQVVRQARGGTVMWDQPGGNRNPGMARMTRNIALAVIDCEEAPFLVRIGEDRLLKVKRGETLEIPVKVIRRGNFKGKLAISSANLPSKTKASNLSIDGKSTTGKYKLTIAKNTPLGTYSFYVQADSQVSYSRNPEAAQRATEQKKKFEKYVAELTATAKSAAQTKEEADRVAKQMADALQRAAKTAKEAEQVTTKGSVEAAEKAKAALAEAKEKAKTAVEAKTKADKAAAEADARAKEADKEKQTFDKQVKKLADAAKAKNVNVYVPSNVVTIKITEEASPKKKKK